MPKDPPETTASKKGKIDALDAGMSDAVTYHDDLYRALSGKTLPDSLMDQVSDNSAKITGWLVGDKLDEVSDEDISAIALGETAKMFGEDVSYDLAQAEEKRIGKLRKVVNLLTRRNRDDAPASPDQASTIEALEKALGKQIEAEHRSAAEGGVQGCRDDRIAYTKLAKKLLELHRAQAALECMETSRQLGRVVAISEEAARAVPNSDRETGHSREGVTREKDAIAGNLQLDYRNLAQDVAALGRRKTALDATAQEDAFQDVRAAFNTSIASASDVFDAAETAADPDDALFELIPENREAFTAAQGKYDAAVEALNEAETILSRALAAAHKVQFDAFKRLCETDGNEVARDGGDLVGGGTVTATKMYASVPKETLGLVAAKLDTLQAVGEGGQFDPVHADLAEMLRAEVEHDITHITEHLGFYKAAEEKIKELRKRLSTQEAACNRALSEELREELNDLEALVATDIDKATLDLATFEAKVTNAEAQFTSDKEALDAFLKAHKQLRKNEIDTYGNALKKLVKKFERFADVQSVDDDDRVHRSWFQKLRGIVHYEGAHAMKHGFILERMDRGVPQDVVDAQAELEALRQVLFFDTAQLGAMDTKINDAQPGQTVPLGDDFADFISDLESSGREINGRKELKETYESEKAALETYMSEKKSTLEPLAQEAFANYRKLLGSLDKGTKTLESVVDWTDFLKSFRNFRDVVEAYVATNKKVDGVSENPQIAAAQALERCDARITEFVADMGRFVDVRIKPVSDFLKKEIKKLGPSDDTTPDIPEVTEMRAIRTIFKDKNDTLTAFATDIGGAVDAAGLTAIGARLKTCAPADAVEIREEALREIRRRRVFLDSAASARLYRDNPFDSGGPALAAVAALSHAESTLLTLIKPA